MKNRTTEILVLSVLAMTLAAWTPAFPQNTAHGDRALDSNTTGDSNSGFGSQALFLNTKGSNNSAFGGGAIGWNATARSITAPVAAM